MTLVGVFAIFHGHAHGTEMPVDAAGAEYAAGLVIATGLLHLIGIGIGLGIARAAMTMTNGRRITQIGGGVIAVLGVGVLMGIVCSWHGSAELASARLRQVLGVELTWPAPRCQDRL